MAKWSLREPKCGDIIRVSIGKNIHHYGIYISDMEVIQYGSGKDIFAPKEDVKVYISTIEEFLGGKFLEVREYSFMEKITKNKPEKVICLAKERLGEAKYDLVKNNCEHFVNDCVFNKHISIEAKDYLENRR